MRKKKKKKEKKYRNTMIYIQKVKYIILVKVNKIKKLKKCVTILHCNKSCAATGTHTQKHPTGSEAPNQFGGEKEEEEEKEKRKKTLFAHSQDDVSKFSQSVRTCRPTCAVYAARFCFWLFKHCRPKGAVS